MNLKDRFLNFVDAIDDGIEKIQARFSYNIRDFDQELFDGIEAYTDFDTRDAKWVEVDESEELVEIEQWAIEHLGESGNPLLKDKVARVASEMKAAKRGLDPDAIHTEFFIYRLVQYLGKESWFKNGKSPADFLSDALPQDLEIQGLDGHAWWWEGAHAV